MTLKTPCYIIYGHEDPIKDLQVVDCSYLVVSVDKVRIYIFII